MSTPQLIRPLLYAAVVLTPTVTIAGPVYGFDVPKLLLMVAFGSVLAVLSAAEVPRLWAAAVTEVRALLVASAMFVAWMLVATLVSDASRLSVLGPDGRFVGTVATVFPAVLVIAVPLAATSLWWLDRWARLLALVLLAISGYAVVQWAGLDPMPWAVPFGGRPVATFGNSNFVGAVLCVTVPMAMWLWYRRPPMRWFAVPLLVLGVWAMWASQARLGWIAAASGAIVFLAIYPTLPSRRVQSWFLAIAPPMAPVVGFLTVVGGAAIQDTTGLARLAYWRAAVPMWLDNPVLGVGLGRFAAFHREYRPPESVIEAGRDITVDSSHAWLLDLAATTGTPGPLLWMAILVAAGLVLRRIWLVRIPSVHPMVSGLTAMLAAHGVQSSISVPTVVPVWLGWALVAWVAALGMLALAPGVAEAAAEQRSGKANGGDGRASKRSGTAARAARSGKSGAGAKASGRGTVGESSVSVDEPRTLVTVALAVIVAIAALIPGLAVWNASHDIGAATSARGAERPDVARERLEQAVARTPWWPEPWRDLTRVAASQGDTERARSALDGALSADDRSRETILVALELTVNMAGWDAATPWVERLRELDPNGLDSNLTVATWALQVGEPATAAEALDVASLTVTPELAQWERYEQLRAAVQAVG